jgi:CspA family cold shock protein
MSSIFYVGGILYDNAHKKQINEFLQNPQGYLTVNFKNLFNINPGGLDQFLEAASRLEDTQGHLQFVNVSESAYRHLMNTNISGKRLISSAEIYTQRSPQEISNIIKSITDDYSLFNIERGALINAVNRAEGEYRRQHMSSLGDEPDSQEIERRKIEYGLIECIRLIEEEEPNVRNHLGYKYGKVDKILRIDDPSILRCEPSEQYTQPTLPRTKNKERKTGSCKLFNETKGYGFIIPDDGGDDLFVHISRIRSHSSLTPDSHYSYQIEEGRQGPEAVNVAPYKGP